MEQRDKQAELLWIAPYNSQVDSAKERARGRPQLWRALQNGKRIKTRQTGRTSVKKKS